jgi:hypothetical protein
MARRSSSRAIRAFGLFSTLGLLGCSGSILPPGAGDHSGSPGTGSRTPAPDAADGGGTGGSGSASGSGGSGSTVPVDCSGSSCGTESTVADSAFPRLSHRQWGLAAQALLNLDTTPDVSGFTNDAPSPTGFDNTGGQLEVSQNLWQDYQGASEQLGEQVASDSTKLAKILPANLPADGDARTKAFVSGFGARALRRPLTAAEVDQYVALFNQGSTLITGRDAFSAGVELTITAMLQSPQFIYQVEDAAQPDANGVSQLSDYSIASRLSFMFWDSMPDDMLFAAAQAGQLHTADQIAKQAQRMLDDARASDKLDEFHRQLLELRRYDEMHPGGLPATIGASLRQETEHFIHDVVVDKSGPLSSLFTSNYSFVNNDVAMIYGLSGTFTSAFVRADLDPQQRSGVLTQPGFLIYRSGDTAPILRGVTINLKWLCADLPPPPVFTPPMMTGDTRRERVNSVTGPGTCGETCHARMINPAGYPLEYFDDAGRYRTQDNGHPVDGSASYTFTNGLTSSYSGPIEWSQTLAQSRQVHECYVRHWLEYGFGRAYDANGDGPLVKRLAADSLTNQRPVKQLLLQLVQSPSFRTRRLEAP